MAISITQLTKYLIELDTVLKQRLLPWSGRSCLAVVCYVLKFCSSSDSFLDDVFFADLYHRDVLCDAINLLDDLATDFFPVYDQFKDALSSDEEIPHEISGKTRKNKKKKMKKKKKNKKKQASSQLFQVMLAISKEFVNSIIPNVQNFFCAPKRDDLLDGFINLLLQIVTCNSDFSQVEEDASDCNESNKSLLMFLLAVLGDITFLEYNELEEVQTILSEFKCIANELGSVVYSSFFSTSSCPAFSIDLVSLNKKIEENLSKLQTSVVLPKNRTQFPADSLFTVESLLEDLDNLVVNVGISSKMG